MAVKFDGNGKKVGEALEIDTTAISIFSDNKIYSTVFSEDRQKIMVYKIQKKNEKFNFSTALYNPQFQLLHRSRISVPYEEKKDSYTDFHMDNDGNFVFAKGLKGGSRELIQKVSIVTKGPDSDEFVNNELNLANHLLDEVKLKVDNINKRYLLNSFYYTQKHGNIQGLFTTTWDRITHRQTLYEPISFNDTLRQEAKTDGSSKLAFNDFFIRNIILRKDGGFILTGEDFYTQSRSNPWNRFDYLNSYPYYNSFDYYNSPSAFYYRPRNFYGGGGQVRYFYDNVVVLSIDKDGKLVWSNVIHKNQYDDDHDNYLSFQLMAIGGDLHFLFNELQRQNELLIDQSVSAEGVLTRNPTLKSLDRGFQFMPKFGKQVSARQIIVPCAYRNYICFAKIEF